MRILDIIKPLEPFLQKQWERNGQTGDYVIQNQYNREYITTDNIVHNFWKPCLSELGLAYRNIYQTRHTFCVMMIQAGEPLAWIRDMLGHVDLKQIVETYGNWIDNEKGRRGTKFVKAFGEEPKALEEGATPDDFGL